MSMLGAKDKDTRSYMAIVDALRRHGATPKPDVEELWRREVFNILIPNTDDHLRNHGFLYAGKEGWRLSPAYDLTVPVDIKPRILTTAINEDDGTASLDLAMSVAGYFESEEERAKAIAARVGKAVSTWRDEGASHGIGKTATDRVESAFEHNDLKQAAGK
jgi:serine/threonine-protein kinase HipA